MGPPRRTRPVRSRTPRPCPRCRFRTPARRVQTVEMWGGLVESLLRARRPRRDEPGRADRRHNVSVLRARRASLRRGVAVLASLAVVLEPELVSDLVRHRRGGRAEFILVYLGDGARRPMVAAPNAVRLRLDALSGLEIPTLTPLHAAVFALVADARGEIPLLRREAHRLTVKVPPGEEMRDVVLGQRGEIRPAPRVQGVQKILGVRLSVAVRGDGDGVRSRSSPPAPQARW